MYTHEFKNAHGRYPVTTDVLDRLQQNLEMLERAIVKITGPSIIIDPPSSGKMGLGVVDDRLIPLAGTIASIAFDVIATEEQHGVSIEGKTYPCSSVKGHVVPSNAVKYGTVTAFPTALKGVDNAIASMRRDLDEIYSDLAGIRSDSSSNLSKINSLIATTSSMAQSIDSIASQVQDINSYHIVKKGMLMLVPSPSRSFDASLLPDGYVCPWAVQVGTELWNKQANFFAGNFTYEETTSTRGTYRRMTTCNGIAVPNLSHDYSITAANSGNTTMFWIFKCV